MTTLAVVGAQDIAQRLGADVNVYSLVSAVFDDGTETWLLRTRSGHEHQADVVVDAERTLHVPRKPLSTNIAEVPVRRRRHWLRRNRRPANPPAACAIADGLPADALIGSRSVPIQHAWRDGAVAYLGVAVHGFPNYFLLLGPGSLLDIDQQVNYIAEVLQEMKRKGSTRVEVRRSVQRQFVERARIKPPALAFDFSTPDTEHQVYDGPATLTIGDDEHSVRVRLTGHLDPIDGKYHWQGTVFGATAELPKRPVTLRTDTLTTAARITEQTPWGSYSIAGVGMPPFDVN